jgi:putative tricarboxylic transport membrane protein
MRPTDLAAGGALIAVGAAMAWTARGFPRLGGMDYGPDLFPTIAAAGLVLSGAGIVAEGLRAPGAADSAARGAADAAPGRGALRAAALVGLCAAFAVSLTTLGFHLAAALALIGAARLFGAGWGAALTLAAVAAPLLHAAFYTALRVPLPWGLLTPVAW